MYREREGEKSFRANASKYHLFFFLFFRGVSFRRGKKRISTGWGRIFFFFVMNGPGRLNRLSIFQGLDARDLAVFSSFEWAVNINRVFESPDSNFDPWIFHCFDFDPSRRVLILYTSVKHFSKILVVIRCERSNRTRFPLEYFNLDLFVRVRWTAWLSEKLGFIYR